MQAMRRKARHGLLLGLAVLCPPAFGQAAPKVDGTGIAIQNELGTRTHPIINTAIISPYYDIEYNDGPASSFTFGDQKSALTLPSNASGW